MMRATTSLTRARVLKCIWTLTSRSSLWWSRWHILLLLLMRLMCCHHHATLSCFINTTTTRHICRLILRLTLSRPHKLATLSNRINCTNTNLLLRCGWWSSNGTWARHIRIRSVLSKLMSQNIILLIWLVPDLLHHLTAHHVHIVRWWRRNLRYRCEGILWPLILLTLPVSVLWPTIAWLTLFTRSQTWISLTIHERCWATFERDCVHYTIMMRILIVSALLLSHACCLVAATIILHAWAWHLSLWATTSMRRSSSLLIILTFIASWKAMRLRIATMRCSWCRNHLAWLAIHMGLRSSTLNCRWLNMQLLSLLVILLLVITSTVVALSWCWRIHLNYLLNSLVLICSLASSASHIHSP